MDPALTEEEVLADVWRQEDDVRADTETWVLGFLALAFGPLENDEIVSYIRISRTSEGRAMNHALFAAFDPFFARISHELGLGAARVLTSEDA